MEIQKYILRYFVFVGMPYFLARKIEKKYFKRTKHSEVEKKSEILIVDNKEIINPNGGEILTISAHLLALITKDFAFKTAFITLVSSTIWADSADTSVKQILKYSSSIIAAPGFKFKSIVNKLRGINPDYSLDIKEILLEKNISNSDKLELIKIKIRYALVNMSRSQKITFFLTIIATVMFVCGNHTPAFTFFIGGIRDLIGKEDDEDTITTYLVEIYKEYHAPLPKELVTQIK
jgi:hypothetical protein